MHSILSLLARNCLFIAAFVVLAGRLTAVGPHLWVHRASERRGRGLWQVRDTLVSVCACPNVTAHVRVLFYCSTRSVNIWACSCPREREAAGTLAGKAVFPDITKAALADLLFSTEPAGIGSDSRRCWHYRASQRVVGNRMRPTTVVPSCRDVYAVPRLAATEPDEYFSAPNTPSSGSVIPRTDRALVRVRGASRQSAYWCFACKTAKCSHTTPVSDFRKRRHFESQRAGLAPVSRSAVSFGQDPPLTMLLAPDAEPPTKATAARRLHLGLSAQRDLSNSHLPASALVPFPYQSPVGTPQLCRWRHEHKCSCPAADAIHCSTPVRCARADCLAAGAPTALVVDGAEQVAH